MSDVTGKELRRCSVTWEGEESQGIHGGYNH